MQHRELLGSTLKMLYSKTLKNLETNDELLDTSDLIKLDQEDMKNKSTILRLKE